MDICRNKIIPTRAPKSIPSFSHHPPNPLHLPSKRGTPRYPPKLHLCCHHLRTRHLLYQPHHSASQPRPRKPQPELAIHATERVLAQNASQSAGAGWHDPGDPRADRRLRPSGTAGMLDLGLCRALRLASSLLSVNVRSCLNFPTPLTLRRSPSPTPPRAAMRSFSKISPTSRSAKWE